MALFYVSLFVLNLHLLMASQLAVREPFVSSRQHLRRDATRTPGEIIFLRLVFTCYFPSAALERLIFEGF